MRIVRVVALVGSIAAIALGLSVSAPTVSAWTGDTAFVRDVTVGTG